jgi:hypothetical protein
MINLERDLVDHVVEIRDRQGIQVTRKEFGGY